MNIDFVCNKTWIFGDVWHQIWEAQTADGLRVPLEVTRLLHNKFFFYANNFSRCYFFYLSPDFVAAAFTIVGLLFFLIGLWYLVIEKKWFVLILLLSAPLLPLFEIPREKIQQGIVLYFIEGAIVVFGVYRLLLILGRRLRR